MVHWIRYIQISLQSHDLSNHWKKCPSPSETAEAVDLMEHQAWKFDAQSPVLALPSTTEVSVPPSPSGWNSYFRAGWEGPGLVVGGVGEYWDLLDIHLLHPLTILEKWRKCRCTWALSSNCTCTYTDIFKADTIENKTKTNKQNNKAIRKYLQELH